MVVESVHNWSQRKILWITTKDYKGGEGRGPKNGETCPSIACWGAYSPAVELLHVADAVAVADSARLAELAQPTKEEKEKGKKMSTQLSLRCNG